MSQATGPADEVSGEPTLNTALHIRYWLRCLKTFLPTGYQEQDSSRLVLAFFILTSLDLLGGLETHITNQEREDYIAFIYRCQHLGGGFRSFPGTNFGSGYVTAENARWDPASVAGTYFALGALAILGDDLSRVRRQETLDWIRNLQHPDGSFGDIAAGKEGIVDGGQDVRFCFLAVLVCAVLGEEENAREAIEKCIDMDRLSDFLVDSQTYDGGMARNPNCESHAGSTYCAVSALKILNLIPNENTPAATDTKQVSPDFLQNLLHWLSYRQTTMLSDYRDTELFDDEEEEDFQPTILPQNPGFTILNATPALPPPLLDFERLDVYNCSRTTVGMNGRVNKPADTCYSFWAGATLAILGHSNMIDREANRRYLLEKTQHRIGGFGKFPGVPPDILHSALALAFLSIHGEKDLKAVDPIYCMSVDARARLDGVAWKRKGKGKS